MAALYKKHHFYHQHPHPFFRLKVLTRARDMQGKRYRGFSFLTPQDRDILLLRSFSPLPMSLKETAEWSSSSPINCIPGDKGDLMAAASSSSAKANRTPSHNDAMANSRKYQIVRDPDDKAITVQETKRQKITNLEQLDLAPSGDPCASQRQPTKAPVRRSQKLGDKITALQQLVSPFGKTDTASVLQEVTIHIRALHQQIRVLASPYFPTRSSYGPQDLGGPSSSLRSRGLCLVPSSSPIVYHANQASYERRAADRKPWKLGKHPHSMTYHPLY